MSTSSMRVRKLTSDEARDWSQVGEADIFVSDIVDQAGAPDAEMTVGFARVAKGEALEISFPYDEVLVITSGRYTVRTHDGQTLTASAGEVIYLPARSANSSVAEQDTEMAYVAAPPSVYAAHVAGPAEA